MDSHLPKQFIQDIEKRIREEKTKNQSQMEELHKNDPFTDPDYANDNAAIDTDAREQINHDTIAAEIKELTRRNQDIEVALKKIQTGKYGYCERCNKAIPTARLELIPEARYCIECEQTLRK